MFPWALRQPQSGRNLLQRPPRDCNGNPRRLPSYRLRAGEGFKLGDGTQAAYDTVRKTNAFIAYDKDIEMFKELEKITDVVKRGDILEAVEDKADLKFF